MGIHDVDYICWLASEKPSSVYATGRRRGPSAEMYKRLGEYDSASALLTFPSGTVGMLELSRECGFGYDQNVEVLELLWSSFFVFTSQLLHSDEEGGEDYIIGLI